MISIPTQKVNINKFWEKTPTPLKYILVFVIFVTVSYFLFSKNMKDTSVKEMDTMKNGITATYQLIGSFEEFRAEQDVYNKQILDYLTSLHTLVQELNSNTNRKLDMILNSGGKNSSQLIEKIQILNESFDRLSKAYDRDVKAPDLEKKTSRRKIGPIIGRQIDKDSLK
jgi:hypothetical protein